MRESREQTRKLRKRGLYARFAEKPAVPATRDPDPDGAIQVVDYVCPTVPQEICWDGVAPTIPIGRDDNCVVVHFVRGFRRDDGFEVACHRVVDRIGRPPPLMSRDHPWGLLDISSRYRKRFYGCNAFARFAIKITCIARWNRVPGIIEHQFPLELPMPTLMNTNEVRGLAAEKGLTIAIADHCSTLCGTQRNFKLKAFL